MEPPVSATLCVSRVLSLAPAEAEWALASYETSLTTVPRGQRRRVVVALTGGTAELHPAPLAGASKGYRRRLVGVLRSQHRCFSVPVDVEVGPGWHGGWGDPLEPDHAELRVRPIGPTCLRSPSHHRLFTRLAPLLAERVACELDSATQVTCA
jgi:hypothetical protein